MINIKKILITILLSNHLICDFLAPDISFIDLPLSAKNASLGNTFLADIGSPTNLLQNPANIWFGNRINSKTKGFRNNIKTRSSISSFQVIDDNNCTPLCRRCYISVNLERIKYFGGEYCNLYKIGKIRFLKSVYSLFIFSEKNNIQKNLDRFQKHL